MIACSGRGKYLHLFKAESFETICKIPDGLTCDLRMTSEHIFIKSAEKDDAKKGWLIISL